MAVKPIPEGYHTVTPYLMAENSEQLLDFLKRAFGATETFRHNDPDGHIRHCEFRIGNSPLMLSEAKAGYPATTAMYHLYVPNVDEVYQQAMRAGASSLREPTDEFYGDRSAGVLDLCGNQWWIATHIEDVSPEEVARRQAALES